MLRTFFSPAFHTLYRSLVDVLYPALCYSCDTRLSQTDLFICPVCRLQIEAFKGELDKALEGRSFDQLFILYEYGPVIRKLIHLLKYQHYIGLCRMFAREVRDRFPCIKENNYTGIVPVPLHKLRKRERGYNQSEEIARAVAAIFGLRLKSEQLLRLRNTSSQTKKSIQQREENMKNAFACTAALYSEKILLIDDVVTTGSTIESCIRSLKTAGAVRVDVLAIAHPPKTI
jgi:ComF family protein